MKPVDLADQLERDFVPRWLAERQRLTGLHVSKRQQPALNVATTHAADRAEMWRLASGTLRSGDVATALDVDGRAVQLAMMLRELTTDLKIPGTDTTIDIAAELQRLQSTEQQSVSRLNRGLASLRTSAAPAGQIRTFAGDVEAHVLGPWNAERQTLRALPVPVSADAREGHRRLHVPPGRRLGAARSRPDDGGCPAHAGGGREAESGGDAGVQGEGGQGANAAASEADAAGPVTRRGEGPPLRGG